MAAILSTARRPSDPTMLEIEARKAEILARQQAAVDELLAEHSMLMADCYDEARITGADPFRLLVETNAALSQRDETEPLDLADHLKRLPFANCQVIVEQVLVDRPKPEPREMSKADICNVDIGSLWVLNSIPDCDEEQYTLGAIDPETVDLEPNAFAEFQEANAKPIAFRLKTEPKTHRDVRSFRSKRK
ncbi:hypothetical protein [Lacipirellula sp.]|uniref:hypothetical protein n=1 Tax=Lacipirellula sp. TaxID=2691419 RepID=UPI003D142F68